MGFSFRKSIKVAPGIRLNVSKKGLGVSAGVKGARVSIGPRGVNAYGGMGPIRYQKQLASGHKPRTSSGKNNHSTETYVDKPSGSFYGTPFELKRPINWWAWMSFFCIGIPASLLSPIRNETITSIGYFIGIGIWLYTLFTGPAKLRAYRRAIKAKTEQMDPGEKVEFFEELNKIYPNNHFKLHLGQSLFESKQYEKAEPLLEDIVSLAPIPLFYAALGDCYKNNSKFDKAIECFEHCDEEHEFENFLLILKYKAESHAGKGDYDIALECVDTGLRKRGEKHVEGKRELKLYRAKLYEAMGNFKKAKTEAKKLISEAPNFTDAQTYLSTLEKESA